MEITLSKTLPSYPSFVEGIRRAPDRGYTLTPAQTATALKNALRYIPKELHETLAPEFMEELRTRGRLPLPPAGRPQSETHRRVQGELH